MSALLSTVVLRNPNTGAVTALVEGEECPEWAVGLITNPEVLEQAVVEPEGDEKGDPDKGSPDKESPEDDGKDGDKEQAVVEPEKPKPSRSSTTKGK